MGKTAATAEFRARGLKMRITNYEFQITNIDEQRALKIFVLLCALFFFFAENSLAQTNFDVLAETISRGKTEQKRDALFQIRNLETAEASAVAVPALRDKSEIVRATAAFSVVFLPPDEALIVLSPLLKDKKELVRREAAYALGKTRNPAAINFLVQTFQTDKIADVKNACVVALGEIGDAAAINFLNGILQRKPKEADDFLRRSAARSIGQIAQTIQTGRREVITPKNFLPEKYFETEKPKYANLLEKFPAFGASVAVLIQTLQNARETDDTRREAAFALGAIGDASATAVLQSNLDAKDYYLAQICKEALQKITDKLKA